MKVRAWLDDDGNVKCLSNYCDYNGDKCKRYDDCQTYEIKIKQLNDTNVGKMESEEEE